MEKPRDWNWGLAGGPRKGKKEVNVRIKYGRSTLLDCFLVSLSLLAIMVGPGARSSKVFMFVFCACTEFYSTI